MADRMALFKAAKAQRGSGTSLVRFLVCLRRLVGFTCRHFSLLAAFLQTKEQIKALKAEKAKAAAHAEAAAKEAAEKQRKHEVTSPPPQVMGLESSCKAFCANKRWLLRRHCLTAL